MTEKVLLLALGDDYWTPFVFDMANALIKDGIEPVIVTDSRVGEYQSFGGRGEAPCKTHYFSDYLRDYKTKGSDSDPLHEVEIDSMFSDYYRLFVYGAHDYLSRVRWVYLKNAMQSFFSQVLERDNVGVVLHDQVSTSFSHVCYRVAKALDVDYLGLVGARIPGRYEVRRSINDEQSVVESIYLDIVSGVSPISNEEKKWAEQFLGDIDSQEPSYMQKNFLNDVRLAAYANKSKFESVVRKAKYMILERQENSQRGFREPPVANSVRSFFRNMMRLIRKKSFAKHEAQLSGKWLCANRFWIYPIHFQPEASTSVGSPNFVDQFGLIRNIAFNLPNDTYLVVKEHQSAIGFHGPDFYRNITSLPNVLLVGPNWNIKQLIRESLGVMTLTSTAAFEALLIGKRVCMFGEAFYEFHPRCNRVDSWVELREELHSNDEVSAQLSEIEFLVAYRRYTRLGVISYSETGWGISDSLVSLIREVLDERGS